jgi:hypothetical protein
MDLRNWEFNQTTGLPVVGAAVTAYEAALTHPPVTSVGTTVTDSNGMWAFAGLSDAAKDVKVEAYGQTKWYKGLTRHGVAAIFYEEPARFKQVATPAAPGAGASLLYFKSDGALYYRSGAAGAETKLLSGSIVNADIDAAAAIALSKLAAGAAGYLKSNGAVISAGNFIIGADITSEVIVNAHIAPTAAIAYSKLSLANSIKSTDIENGTIVNEDISGSAAIAYSKLSLGSSIVNADISNSAAIAYSKLNLANSIVNADIAAEAISKGGFSAGPGSAKDTTSTSFVDVDAVNSILQWTSSGGMLYIWAIAGATNTTNTTDRTQIAVNVNGTDIQCNIAIKAPSTGFIVPITMLARTAAVAAGNTITIKGRFKNVDSSSSTARVDGFQMLAIEVKK